MAVETHGLTKDYDSRMARLVRHFGIGGDKHGPAIDQLSVRICHDEITAVLGPNSSGKSTLVGLLAGTVMPSSGSVKMLIGESRVAVCK